VPQHTHGLTSSVEIIDDSFQDLVSLTTLCVNKDH